MFFEDLCLGRAWTIGVFAFIASPCARAADGLFTVAFLIIVSDGQLPNSLSEPFSVSWLWVRVWELLKLRRTRTCNSSMPSRAVTERVGEKWA